MVQAKRNSSSGVLNVELNVLATPQCCRRSCSTCMMGKSFAKEHIAPTRLFTNSAPPMDVWNRYSGISILHPSDKIVQGCWRSSSAPSVKQRQMVASAEPMHGIVLKLTMIPQPGFGCIITLQSKSKLQPPIYQVTISSYPKCNCANFVDMAANASC